MTERKILSNSEMERYSRQIKLSGIGIDGQQALKQARVLIVGLGGLGSPASLYLAAAGVGCLGLMDGDRVELSNLQRQILFDTGDLNNQKLNVAQRKVSALNPFVEIKTHLEFLNQTNAKTALSRYDLVLDCTDNFESHYLINDTCVALKKPLIYAQLFQYQSQISTFLPEINSPCYRCLFPKPPASPRATPCSEVAVLGALAGMVGAMQAMEAIKLILKQGESLGGRVLRIDGLDFRQQEFKLKKNLNCKACYPKAKINNQIRVEDQSSVISSVISSLIPSQVDDESQMDSQKLDLLMKQSTKNFTLLDVREAWESSLEKLQNAVCVPVGELNKIELLIPKDLLTIVYCKSGYRSRQAVEILKNKQFNQVKSLKGGLDAYQKAYQGADKDTQQNV